MKNHKLGILKVRDNFQSCGEIESTQEFEFYGRNDIVDKYEVSEVAHEKSNYFHDGYSEKVKCLYKRGN